MQVRIAIDTLEFRETACRIYCAMRANPAYADITAFDLTEKAIHEALTLINGVDVRAEQCLSSALPNEHL